MIKLFLLISFLFLVIQNETFTAKVIGVTDGDTIVVLTNDNKQIKIRLEGIDCPETKQDFGTKAKQLTVDLCFQKTVRIEQSGTDRYGRMLAFVFLDDVCINKELIKQGMAWHYKQYNKDQELASLEEKARNRKIGIWSQNNPVAPWDFRKK
jgi:endonuclease YncB( thermonuclease family)